MNIIQVFKYYDHYFNVYERFWLITGVIELLFLAFPPTEYIMSKLTSFIGRLVFELLRFGLNPFHERDQPYRLIVIKT